MRSRALFFLCLFFMACGATSAVHAQSSAGVELKPSSFERAAEPGKVMNETLTLTNLSTTEQTYYLVTRDVSGVGDEGRPIFAEAGAEITGYELSSWVSYPQEPLTLAPRASVDVPIRLAIPDTATPGSHFGGVFVTVQPPRLRESGAGVAYEVGSLISIRIAGDALEDARIREFSTKKLLNGSANIDFLLRVENPGKVLIQPRGPLEIYNMLGKRIAFLTVNDSLAGVFPGQTRQFDINWKGEGFSFGRYQAVLGLGYGEKGKQSSVSGTVSFWILPVKIIVPVFGVLTLIILVVYVSIKLYVRRALDELSTTQGRRTVVRRRKDSSISRLMVIAVTLLISTALFLIGLLLLFA